MLKKKAAKKKATKKKVVTKKAVTKKATKKKSAKKKVLNTKVVKTGSVKKLTKKIAPDSQDIEKSDKQSSSIKPQELETGIELSEKANKEDDERNKKSDNNSETPKLDKVVKVRSKRKTRKKSIADENHRTGEIAASDSRSEELESNNNEGKRGGKMIVLSTINDISEVTKLHEKWQEHLSSPLIVINASAVEKMDTSVLQLLTTLIQSADENNVDVKWDGASQQMKHAVKLLGLNGPLKLH